MAIFPAMERLSVRDETACDFSHCYNKKMEGSTRCQLHGGNLILERTNKANIRAYRLHKWKERLNEFCDSDTIKSLREEIGIARITLESILNQCADDFDLLIAAPKISMMLKNIESLVSQCNKLEDKLGYTLDKSAAINLAEQIVQIISEHIPEERADLIASQIALAIVGVSQQAQLSDS